MRFLVNDVISGRNVSVVVVDGRLEHTFYTFAGNKWKLTYFNDEGGLIFYGRQFFRGR